MGRLVHGPFIAHDPKIWGNQKLVPGSVTRFPNLMATTMAIWRLVLSGKQGQWGGFCGFADHKATKWMRGV